MPKRQWRRLLQTKQTEAGPRRALSRAKPTSPKCNFIVSNLQYICVHERREGFDIARSADQAVHRADGDGLLCAAAAHGGRDLAGA